MAMTTLKINLTLVVQMVHFFFAYLVINRLLLKPGYKVVSSDAHRIKQVKSRIVARQELIAHKQGYKQTRWKLFQDYFYKQKPQLQKEYSVAPPRPLDEKLPEFSREDLDTLSTAICASIEKRVLS